MIYTFSPILIPVSWKSELVKSIDDKYNTLKSIFMDLGYFSNKCDWPIGYGSLEYDKLPVFFQPTSYIDLNTSDWNGAIKSELYIYDDCISVLYMEIDLDLSDIEVSDYVERYAKKELSGLFYSLFEYDDIGCFISPKKYETFKIDKIELCSSVPKWVARTRISSYEDCEFENWLPCIDSKSDSVLLGSGNSVVLNDDCFFDFKRVMIFFQFYYTLMNNSEDLLKDILRNFNSNFYASSMKERYVENYKVVQYLNDHIEYVEIQFSSSIAGMQGKRRAISDQFVEAWKIDDLQNRVSKYTCLVQQRIEREIDRKRRVASKRIQTALTMIGVLSLLSIVLDLSTFNREFKNGYIISVLKIFDYLKEEMMLNIVFLVSFVLVFVFYRRYD